MSNSSFVTSFATRFLCFLLLVVVHCLMAAAQSEPRLLSLNVPEYPPLAVQAHVEGIVKLTFTLPANAGAPTNIEVVSGQPLLNSVAIESVKSWKFKNPYAVERKYETTFRYHLSAFEVSSLGSPTITLKSFHEIDLVSDIVKPTPIY
jgi:hypothetical protein